jgi:acyl-coenzyme A thioesterase PaaI-like protein
VGFLKQGGDPDIAALLAAIPYCRYLGIDARIDGDRVSLCLPYAPHLIGNPTLPALHGGVMLETAAILQVLWETRVTRLPKPVDIAIDYLRSGRPVESFAQARIAKQGRRVVNVQAEMWQDDEAKPIAALRGHFLLAVPNA